MLKRNKEKQSLTLVLGGGGARGMAHVGVLRILEREEIPILRIVGTSMGAVIGAMYAQHPDVAEVERRLKEYFEGELFAETGFTIFRADDEPEGRFARMVDQARHYVRKRVKYHLSYSKTFMKSGIFNREPREMALRTLLDKSRIEECAIPFAAVATDLISGEAIAVTGGSLHTAVAASMSIPGVFPPIRIGEKMLVDGSVIYPVPVRVARSLSGGGKILAVDVSRALPPVKQMKRGFSILLRAEEISRHQLTRVEIAEADVVLRPKVGAQHWSEFEHADMFVRLGEEACEEALPKIREMVGIKK